MNSQLLCSQALLESTSFKLLPYDNLSQIRKNITKLENQLDSLHSKLKLEIKLLQASNLLRHDANDDDDEDPDEFLGKFRRLYDQKESIQSQLADLRTLLFQHLAAALALGYKKLENLNHPLNAHYNQPPTHFNLLRSPSPPSTHPSSRSTRSTTFTRFDGPHMLANDQSASSIFSHQYSSAPEPFHPSSPRSKSIEENNQSNLLKDEITSLQALLKARDSIIAEQSSDIHLLELEVETLKQSLSDQSSSHTQLTRDQSKAHQTSQIKLDSLQSQNSQLTQALQSSKAQVDSTTKEINQLKSKIERLNSDLLNQRSHEGNRQKNHDDRLQQAENRAKLSQESQVELNLQVSNLKSELEKSNLASREVKVQAEKLTSNLKAYQDREIGLQAEIESLQARTILKEQFVTAQEAEIKADWEFLIDRLLTLKLTLHDNQTNPPKLVKLLSQLSSSPPSNRSGPLNNRKKLSEDLVDGMADYIAMMEKKLLIAQAESESSSHVSTNTADELEKLRQSNEQQKSALTTRITELESINEELKTKIEAHQTEQEGDKNDNAEVDALKLELVTVKQRLAEKESSAPTDTKLRELWKLLPANLDSRAAMNLDSDLSQLKSIYDSPRKPTSNGGGGGLGGLFGLARRAATTVDEPLEFSIESMVDKIRLVLDNDRKLIDRLILYEAEKDSHKSNAIRAQKLVTESQDALRIYQSQVKELEESLEYANTQSAAMLEKVNDLMESEERANMVARRAETSILKLQAEIEDLKTQLKSLSPP